MKNDTVGAHPGMHVRLVKVRFTISDPVRGDTTSLWTIRNLPPGGSVREEVNPCALFRQQLMDRKRCRSGFMPKSSSQTRWNRRASGSTMPRNTGPLKTVVRSTTSKAGVNRYTNGDIAIDVPAYPTGCRGRGERRPSRWLPVFDPKEISWHKR